MAPGAAETSAGDLGTDDAAPGHGDRARHSYGQILKSSVVIGGSSVLTLATGVVRSKAIAMLLGPAGFGLMGLYTSIAQLAQSISGMGVNASGVRQIAAAAGTGDVRDVARTAAVLRRTSFALGLIGAALVVALARPISVLTFGDGGRRLPVALLGLVVFFGAINQGQAALIQGLRRIADLARMNALGALAGAVASVALVAWLGEGGVVPALVATAAASVAFSWWHARTVELPPAALPAPEVRREVAGLLKLGFAFMANGMLMTGAAYVVRILVVRSVGFHAAGLYQSAWTIGGLYVGFILQAMGADFYPRLTAAIRDRTEANRLVNEQAHVSLLLAGPGVIATLVLAPLVLTVLYSTTFRDGVGVLRWICLGAGLQVITWPIGYIVVAEGRQAIFFWIQVAYAGAYLAAAAVLVHAFGLDGAGMAFFASYVFHWALVYPIVRRLTGFRWSAANRRTGLLFLALVGGVFGAFHVLPFAAATGVGLVALVLDTAYSLRALARLVSPERLPRPSRSLLALAGARGGGPGAPASG